MQQREDRPQSMNEHADVRLTFAQLQVPVAEVLPDEGIEPLPYFAQTVGIETGGDVANEFLQRVDKRFVGERAGFVGRDGLRLLTELFALEQDETARVPELVHEVAVTRDLLFVQPAVVARTLSDDHREAQRVGAVGFDHVERVDHRLGIGLAHLLALARADQAVQIDRLERHLAVFHLGDRARRVGRHQDHARHPEKQDVIAGLHHLRGMEGLNIRTFQQKIAQTERVIFGQFWIDQRAPGPERGAEPGVERVRILLPALALGRQDAHVHVAAAAIVAVPHRHAVPPPDLARDAPVTEVIDPVEVRFFEPVGNDRDLLRAHHLLHHFFQADLAPFPVHDGLIHVDEPLLFDLRFDHALAALAERDVVDVILFDGHQQAFRLELLDDLRTRVLDVQAGELPRRGQQLAVEADDLLLLQIVTLGDIEIDVVVPRRDRHHTRTERGVDGLVLDDRRGDGSVDPLALELLAVRVLGVALVVRMHDDVLVAELRLGARRGDLERPVLERVERLFALGIFDLVIGDGRLKFGVPVHDAVAAVDQTVLIHAHEHLVHAAVERGLQRVALARPVAAAAHFAHLRADRAAADLHERRDLPQQFLAAERGARIFHLLLFLDLLDDHALGGDGGVVGARHPQRFLAFHPAVADEDIFKSEHDGMAQMQLTRGVGRRHADGERLLLVLDHVLRVRAERATVLPQLVDAVFGSRWVVGFLKHAERVVARPAASKIISGRPGRPGRR